MGRQLVGVGGVRGDIEQELWEAGSTHFLDLNEQLHIKLMRCELKKKNHRALYL